MMTTRGKYKSVTDLPGFYESVRFFDAPNGDLLVRYPQVSYRHIKIYSISYLPWRFVVVALVLSSRSSLNRTETFQPRRRR